jgi:hypothetical protein
MQLDLFEHSRDVTLRNQAIEAARAYSASALSRAIATLATEWPAILCCPFRLSELAWMAPSTAAALADALQSPDLDGLVRRFNAEFEGDGQPGDFAWFPAYQPLGVEPIHHSLHLFVCWRRVQVRSCKYLNNIVEQDHRAVKGRCVPMMGFQSFDSAATTIAGIELARRIRKKQFALGHARGACRFNMRTAWERALFGAA